MADGPGWKVTVRTAGGARWRRLEGDQWHGPGGRTFASLDELHAALGPSEVAEVAGINDLVAECLLNREAADRSAEMAAHFAQLAVAAEKARSQGGAR